MLDFDGILSIDKRNDMSSPQRFCHPLQQVARSAAIPIEGSRFFWHQKGPGLSNPNQFVAALHVRDVDDAVFDMLTRMRVYVISVFDASDGTGGQHPGNCRSNYILAET